MKTSWKKRQRRYVDELFSLDISGLTSWLKSGKRTITLRLYHSHLGNVQVSIDNRILDTGGYICMYFEISNISQVCVVRIIPRGTNLYGIGTRYWFGCPICESPRRTMYFDGNGFACRTCHGLVYQTQYMDKRRRRTRKLQKKHKELGGDGDVYNSGIPQKPKSMHYSTYNKKVQEYVEISHKR